MSKRLLMMILVWACINPCFGQANTAIAQINPKLAKDTTQSLQLNNPSGMLTPGAVKKIRTAPWYVQKFNVAVGFFWVINNTDIKVDAVNNNTGTDIDFENDLGFNKSSQTFLGDFQWRSSARSRFDLSYIRVHRSSDYTLQKTIEFGGETYDVNTSINAFFNTDIYRLSYGYAIFSDEKYEAGLQIGAHVVKASLGISATGANINAAANKDFGVTAPLPDLGVFGGYVIDPKWALNGDIGYLKVTIDNITGRIWAYNFAVAYKVSDNVRFTAGYTGLNFKVSTVRDKLSGDLKWGYNGPSISAIFSFGSKGWK